MNDDPYNHNGTKCFSGFSALFFNEVHCCGLWQDFELNIYNPSGSSTSKKVTCNNSLCTHRNQCLGTFSNCPYMVSYVSAETSTSGILVEDVLHLTKEDNHHELVEANVIFGLVLGLSYRIDSNT